MRKLWVLLGVMLLSAGCPEEWGQDFSILEVSLSAAPAEISIPVLWGGRPQVHVVELRNAGQAPAVITGARVEALAGPADVTVTFEQDRVPAEGEVALRVRFVAPEGALGLLTGRAVVDVQDEASLEIPFVAEVRPVPPCDDGNPCTEDRFDGVQCVNTVVADQTPCDDGNACTENTMCAAGRCLGQPVTCRDLVDCTIDVCDPEVGCRFEPLASRCDDEDPCTEDVCSPTAGCQNPAVPDYTPCFFNGCETVGLCVFGLCTEHDVPNGFPCEDGDPCTEGDSCQEGTCASGDPTAVGAEPPVTVQSGPALVDFCNDLTSLNCNGSAFAEPEEVLASSRDAHGVTRVVWRSAFVSNFGVGACTPYHRSQRDTLLDLVTVNPFIPPEPDPAPPPDGGGARQEEPPPPPLEERCGAGIFMTRLQGSTATTRQVGMTYGPAAAAVGPLDVSPVVFATSSDAGDRVSVFRVEEVPTMTVSLLGSGIPGTNVQDFSNPLERLAMSVDESRIVLVGHKVARRVWPLAEDVAQGQIFEPFPAIEVRTWTFFYELPPGPVPAGSFLLDEVNDDGIIGVPCIDEPTWAPVDAASFDVLLDGDHAYLSLLIDPRRCGSLSQGTLHRQLVLAPYDPMASFEHAPLTAFADVTTQELPFAPVDVASFDVGPTPELAVAVVDLETCGGAGAADPIPEPLCDGGACEPGVPAVPCGERQLREILVGSPPALGPALHESPLSPWASADLEPLLTEDGPATVARVGQAVSLIWRDDDGEAQRIHAPVLETNTWWDEEAPLAGDVNVVAGMSTRYVPCECGDADVDCDCAVQYLSEVTVQGFSCRGDPDLEPPPDGGPGPDFDGGLPDDAGLDVDAGPLPDGGPLADAGQTDGGSVVDGGEVSVDGGTAFDGGAGDGGPTATDAGLDVDAGPSDAGLEDGGAVDPVNSDAGA